MNDGVTHWKGISEFGGRGTFLGGGANFEFSKDPQGSSGGRRDKHGATRLSTASRTGDIFSLWFISIGCSTVTTCKKSAAESGNWQKGHDPVLITSIIERHLVSDICHNCVEGCMKTVNGVIEHSTLASLCGWKKMHKSLSRHVKTGIGRAKCGCFSGLPRSCLIRPPRRRRFLKGSKIALVVNPFSRSRDTFRAKTFERKINSGWNRFFMRSRVCFRFP